MHEESEASDNHRPALRAGLIIAPDFRTPIPAKPKDCNPFAIRFLVLHRFPSLLVPSGAL